MTDAILNIVFGAIVACLTHEIGHFFAGLGVGLRVWPGVTWREFKGFKYPQPCVFCAARDDASSMTLTQRRCFGIGGFGTEALAGLAFIALLDTPGTVVDKPFLLAYWGIFTLHLVTYPFRNAGREDSDFHWLD